MRKISDSGTKQMQLITYLFDDGKNPGFSGIITIRTNALFHNVSIMYRYLDAKAESLV